ncbi:MAG: Dyp-type peroxidase, partial [Moraxellaceae bacterium]|nr:Dyp-type peroxidase [Moraxellaceae bacterium]
MSEAQSGILAALPPQARYLLLQLKASVDTEALKQVLTQLQTMANGDELVVGFGLPIFAVLGQQLPGLTTGPVIPKSLVPLALKEAALWCWLRGNDRGDLLRLEHCLTSVLDKCFDVVSSIDAFVYKEGRDLTGYEDGTENPEGDEAVHTALVSPEQADTLSKQTSLSASAYTSGSFVAVQQWLHDFKAFDAMDQLSKDHTIGRRLSDNEEIDDAPITAHVKRTEQEGFAPEAFVLRRSMPWTAGAKAGLVFVAFGHSLDAFERMLTRMSGAEDGQIDSLFSISKPIASSYFWCPPVLHGQV